ncbi:BACON domain-containing carbohydrate-binding protein [Butyricimonas sp.]|uniref:BACON domain-containing protein n=1 Tax=Butyricimonas sp. TaxID=1969738 RepID=UPI0025B8F348|nr:BACON domain-containing carbohydrate-binding protein [Butyricimonas sp.]
MKKWMVLLVCFICSCACDDKESNDKIQTSSDVANFEQEGGEISILIQATADWSVEVDNDWCFVQPDKENGAFFVIASENENPTPRMTVLRLIAGNCVKEIDVVQEGSDEINFFLSENEASVYDLNDNYAVVVHSDVPWTANNAGNWFVTEPVSGEAGVTLVKIRFSQNTLNAERQGKITFESKNGDVQEFRFKQEAALLDSRRQDSLALIAFYNAVHGDELKAEGKLENWKEGNLETWQGVVLENNRVFNLVLTMPIAQGYIPTDFKYLSHLKYLNLSGTGIGGTIPKELGRCVNLQTCVLGENIYSSSQSDLSGDLPNSVCALQKLEHFTCCGTHVGGILPELYGNLSRLISLNLSKNAITGPLPVAWKYLVQVAYVELESNALVGEFPQEWSVWKNITTFDVSNNVGLYGVLPPEIVAVATSYGGSVNIRGTNIVNE